MRVPVPWRILHCEDLTALTEAIRRCREGIRDDDTALPDAEWNAKVEAVLAEWEQQREAQQE